MKFLSKGIIEAPTLPELLDQDSATTRVKLEDVSINATCCYIGSWCIVSLSTGVLSMVLFGTQLNVIYFMGIVNVVTAVGLYNGKDLDQFVCS